MRVLIIALPRTGSTSLLDRIAKERNLRPIFEPFSRKDSYYLDSTMQNIVVKTIIKQHPDNFALAETFDEVILLGRRNFKKHLESVSFLHYNIPKGYDSNQPYDYVKPPFDVVERTQELLNIMNFELQNLSIKLNVPIQYYEDLFDENSPDRLRIKKNESKSFI